MSDRAKNDDIEDVLSSIRRLVSDTSAAPLVEPVPDRLVLTPALRVADPEDPYIAIQPRFAEDEAGDPEAAEAWQEDAVAEDEQGEPEPAEDAPSDDEAAQTDAGEEGETVSLEQQRRFGLTAYTGEIPREEAKDAREGGAILPFRGPLSGPRDTAETPEAASDHVPEAGPDDAGVLVLDGMDDDAAEPQAAEPDDAPDAWSEAAAENADRAEAEVDEGETFAMEDVEAGEFGPETAEAPEAEEAFADQAQQDGFADDLADDFGMDAAAEGDRDVDAPAETGDHAAVDSDEVDSYEEEPGEDAAAEIEMESFADDGADERVWEPADDPAPETATDEMDETPGAEAAPFADPPEDVAADDLEPDSDAEAEPAPGVQVARPLDHIAPPPGAQPDYESETGDTDWPDPAGSRAAMDVAAARLARGEEPAVQPVFSRALRRDTSFRRPAEPEPPRPATGIADEGFDAAEEPDDPPALDEEALRELIAQVVREELQGALGQRITRNVRKMVRREIRLALAAEDFD